MQVEGDFQVGEATNAAMAAQRRIYGTPWLIYLGLFAAVMATTWAALTWVGPWLEAVTHFSGIWLLLLLAIVLAWIGFGRRALIGLIKGRHVKRLAARGVSGPLRVVISLDEAGVTSTIGQVVKSAGWPAVTEIIPAGAYWVVMAQGEAFYVAKRFFADAAAERAFVRAVFGRLSPEAQARSREAGRLAGAA